MRLSVCLPVCLPVVLQSRGEAFRGLRVSRFDGLPRLEGLEGLGVKALPPLSHARILLFGILSLWASRRCLCRA
jgi:hypothetical protein